MPAAFAVYRIADASGRVAQSAVRRDHQPAGRRAEAGEAVTAGCSAATDEPRARRPAVPSADRRGRPARAAEAARRRARTRWSPSRSRSTATAPPPPHRPRAPYRIYASDDTGDADPDLSSTRAGTICEKLLPVGELRYVSGTVALYDGMLQMVHPDRVVAEAELAKLPLVEPVYPLTEGLTPQPGAQGGRRARWTRVPDAAGMAGRRPGSRASSSRRSREALRSVHRPAEPADVAARKPGLVAARLSTSCSPASSRSRWCARIMRRPAGRAQRRRRATCARSSIAALPYALTPSQSRAIADIVADLAKPRAHAAAAAGRCRLRQDRGGAARRRDRDRGRPPGRADGADRNSGAPASQDHRAARRGRRHPRRAPDRPRARPRARRACSSGSRAATSIC